MAGRRAVAIVLAGAFMTALCGVASADALRRLVAEGNRLFADGKFEQALEKYRSAQVEAPESPYLYFNIGAALQNLGKFDEAVAEYRKVYSRQAPWLGARALYNIGVCQYRQAEQAIAAQDYQKALELLEACMESNREAMKIDPADEDPKFNYEQAKRKWKEVLDALKKQRQEQRKNQQQQQQKSEQQKKQQGKDQQQEGEQEKESDKDGEKNQQEREQAKSREQPVRGQDRASSATEQAQPQAQPGEMTREEAERILNSLREQSPEEMRRFLMPRGRAVYRVEKDW